MKCVSFLYTQSESTKAEKLKDLLQTKLRAVADVKSVEDMIAEDQDVKDELTISDCVVLIGSRQASSMIQNNKQEIEDEFVLFDGSLIRKMFTAKHGRLVIVFFSKKDKNDWIPPGFDAKKIFHFPDEKIQRGNTILDQLEDCIKGILFGNNRV